MEEKELNEIIKLEQLPIITQQLDVISKEIELKVSKALELDCNEETVKEIKKVRADFNKEFKSLEDKRKQVKSAIMEKYDAFEEIYKEKISNIYKNADESLKEKIDSVESDLKKEKEIELREFVEEHCKANNVDIPFEMIGLNITLSASMKSLKEQAKEFIERVASEVSLIEQEEYLNELLMEYLNDFNFVNAKTRVLERHKQLEEIQRQKDGKEIADQLAKEIVEKVDEVIAPVEIEEKETYEFKVKATKSQVKQLVEFMKSVDIEYE